MQPEHATEHLQVIRTLMERSTLYRRALAPTMVLAGAAGTAAAAVGLYWRDALGGEVAFVSYWLAVGVLALSGAMVVVRRQALKAGEPFWSLPTRRVVHAALPAGGSGFVLALVVLVVLLGRTQGVEIWQAAALQDLPLAWVVLYGCALHAAGFFMPRGIKWFGWGLILGAWALFAGLHFLGGEAAGFPARLPAVWGHGVMGLFFGVLHLAYGFYLATTEHKTPAA